MRLKDLVAIVTGGARGIGKEYALRLSQEGAKVVVTDILDAQGTAQQIQQAGGEALALHTDVADEKSTEEMARSTVARFGRIDILVNNAALFVGVTHGPFDQIPIDEWDKVMAINVKGIFLCCKAVYSQMKKQGKGKIINISSGTVMKGTPNFLHYVTSKGAVIGLTRALAREVGPFGIYVNAIAPGYTLSEGVVAERELQGSTTDHAINPRSIKRSQRPEDLTGTVVYLASDDSDFLTGQTICVDGGSSMH